MTEFVFDMKTAQPAEVVGGKAAVLMALVHEGFNIPPFFAITPEAFQKSGLKAAAKKQITAALGSVKGKAFAVRSSGRSEDGAAHSHAGQFLTTLNVPRDNVAREAEKVWKSGDAAHLQTYRKSKGIVETETGPAVLVQAMLAPRCAGVTFTADPVTGRQDTLVISATKGLADKLVNGEIDGETYVLRKGVAQAETVPEKPLLKKEDLKKLAALCEKVEDFYSTPQDIEWAFVGKTLYLLQSRPITSPLRAKPISDSNKIVFDNSNIIESYPGFVSPLTFSFAQYSYARVYRQLVSLLGVKQDKVRRNSAIFDNMLSRVDGRVYYNLLNWYRALALLPGFSINRDHMETMMGVDEPLPTEISASIGDPPATGLRKWIEYFNVAKVGLRLIKETLVMRWTRKSFMKRLNIALARPESDLPELSLSELAAEYRGIEAQVLDQWDAPLINDFLCMFAYGGSRKLIEKWAGERGVALHNDILIGQGNIISAEPARRIRKMGAMLADHPKLKKSLAKGNGSALANYPEIQAEIDAYLEKFKDRCTEELKLESVTLDRDPAPLYMAISAAADFHPAKNKSVFGDDTESETLKQVFEGHPIRGLLIRPLLSWAKRRVRDRENLRFERTRVFGRARRILRAIGSQFHAKGVLDDPEDVFFLTVQEILGAIEGFNLSADLKRLIDLRKFESERDALIPERGSRFIIDGAMVTGLGQAVNHQPAQTSTAGSQTGIGCSAGSVTARVKIIRDPKRERLEKGDILVAKHTDPGWIAVFSNASAIIVERGSLLSHSAIVARELGIPCVVALKGAMSWLKDGETVTVDGASGEVRRENG